MKQTSGIKTILLLILMLGIIAGGLFFDIQETIDFSNTYSNEESISSDSGTLPLRQTHIIESRNLYIVAASEVKDVRSVDEIIKNLSKTSSEKRIIILRLILCILISEGAFFISVLPSVFPWTSIVCSRRTIIQYIHGQDGAK